MEEQQQQLQEDPQFSPPPAQHQQRPIKLNVGGKLFETTASTLQSAGPDSLLSLFSNSTNSTNPIFIDRDPEIFSVLLSLLRSSRLPSTALRRFSKHDLADEALYYGLDPLLLSALAPPPLSAIDASRVTTILPSSSPFASAFSSHPDGSVWIAHGGQISAYDWILSHVATVRTHFDHIASIRRAWPEVAAVGSVESPGLHFYDVVSGGRHVGAVHWKDPSDPRVYKARVASIAVDPAFATTNGGGGTVFAAFECPHRENAILAIDRETLKVVSEIGRQSGGAIKTAVPTKLAVVPQPQHLVFASAVSVGAFGYSGYMRLWDVRSGEAVWETTEPGSGRSSSRFGDSFADADLDGESSAIYKVCWKTGDLAVADLRKLGDDPWVYLEERSTGLRNAGGGEGSVVHCYKKQVFVSREGGLEVWSQVNEEDGDNDDDDVSSRALRMRRNFVDREEDAQRGMIRRMEGGGDRLFVSREGVEGVEVWESSDLSGAMAAASL